MSDRERGGDHLPPWLLRKGAGDRQATLGRRLRTPALLLVGVVIGWVLHALRPTPPPAVASAPPPPVCPTPSPCGEAAPAAKGPARAAIHKRKETPLALVPLPDEGPTSEEKRRELLRAYAEKKASELRACLAQPGQGPLHRVGVALELDGRGAVAAVQILGGDATDPGLAACYAGRLRSWQFPTALLDGPERLLVNFVL